MRRFGGGCSWVSSDPLRRPRQIGVRVEAAEGARIPTWGDRAGSFAYVLVALATLVFVGSLLLRPAGRFLPAFDVDLNLVVEFAAAGLCLASVARRRARSRLPDLLLGSALLLWTVGDLLFSTTSPEGAPVPSPADGFFLAFYPLAYLAVALGLHRDARQLLPGSWVDGALGGLSCLTLLAAFGGDVVLRAGSGPWAQTCVNLAYPIGDFLLLALVTAVLAVVPYRELGRHRPWLLLLVGCALFAASDTWYLIEDASDAYVQGTLLDAGWPVALVLMSVSVWVSAPRGAPARLRPWATPLVLPASAAAVGAGVLVYGSAHRLSPPDIVLASVTLLGAVTRSALALRRLTALESERLLRIQAEQARCRLEAREADIRALADRLAGLLKAAPVGIVEIDGGGQVRGWNRAAERLYGWSEEEVLGRPDPNPALPAQPGESVRHVCKDGHGVEVEVALAELAEPDRPSGLLKVITDVTDRNQLELQLRHAQKLEAVGGLAQGLAHELNTPIQFTTDAVRFLQDAMEAVRRLQEAGLPQLAVSAGAGRPEVAGETFHGLVDVVQDVDLDFLAEEGPQAAQHALDGLDRIGAIVRAIGVFGRPAEKSAKLVDVNEAVSAVLVIAEPRIAEVADVVRELGELQPVCGHPGDINQAILDVVLNAVDAMGAVQAEKGRGRLHVLTREEGTDVLIEITDTGPGIPAHIAGRIFDPFFTTKPVGQGIGQGLSVARAVIINGHGGDLTFRTEPGQGTTFVIRLPIG
ncbi:MAG TPA: ATP-binding protein [Kineosporiaceae bacterium]|nr:ATP-binding protein [Kineosporiaceae bacterium]